MDRTLVLASSSRYRARLLADAGIDVTIDPPDVDERAFDDLLGTLGADGLALELARRKAMAVADRHPDAVLIAADQVGVLTTADGQRLLTKQPTLEGAVDQLLAMSGTSHELVNGLVVLDTRAGRSVEGVDRQQVVMRTFGREEAHGYVTRFEPWDSSGSYRLEDQEAMSPIEPFVEEVRGEHDSGVLGLPLPLLRRLLEQLGLHSLDGR
jgi:septum formation protein